LVLPFWYWLTRVVLDKGPLNVCVFIGRKRKGSTDGSVSDGSVSQRKKQARVNFTAEQKDALRRAYETDPYPTQPSIDRLATELGIGPRTVINWFHNHRMRYAKQQYAATGIWSVTGAATMAVKREPSSDLDLSSQSCCDDGGWDSPPATGDVLISNDPSTPVSDTQPAVDDLPASSGIVASPGSGANRRKNTRPQRLGTSEGEAQLIHTMPTECHASDKEELHSGVEQLPTVVAS